MKDELRKIDSHIQDLAEIVISKNLNHNYTFYLWNHYFEDNELFMTFEHDDHDNGLWNHSETFSLDVIDMDTYDFGLHLDELAEERWQEQLRYKKKQKQQKIKDQLKFEEQEYEHYKELHDKYGDI